MADGATPYYNLTLPEVGASADTWGVKTNTNWTSVDADLHAVSAAQGNYLPLTGGNLSGPLYVAAPGITYGGRSGHYHEFDWDGSFVQGFVDGTYVGQLATVGWANGTFATYGWVNGNFYPAGTTDGRYLYKGGDTCTGNLTVNGNLTTPNQLMGNTIQCSSGVFYVANLTTYYMQRNSANGHWYWVDNSTVIMDLDPGGTLHCPGTVYANNGVYAIYDGSCGMAVAGTQRHCMFNTNAYWSLLTTTGDLTYISAAGSSFQLRYSDGLCYGVRGPGGGNGAYQNISDERMKTVWGRASCGLAEVLRLEPIRFTRRPVSEHDNVVRRPEIGLSAQQVREVIPEAVSAVGVELPDGSGGLDSDNPTLAIGYDAITTALVNAVKELAAEVAALKAARA